MPATVVNNNGAILSSTTADTLNADYRLIATFNGGGTGTTTLYTNGVSVKTGANDTTTGNLSSTTSIGGNSGATNCIIGRIYSVALMLTSSPGISQLDSSMHGYCVS
jgi:hypothetical protein